MNWKETDGYLRGIRNGLGELPDPVRVAGFDLDDTLIQKPKRRGPQAGEWKIIDPVAGKKISGLARREYIIVVFTNQAGMTVTKNFDKQKWKDEMEALVEKLMGRTKNYYFAVYVAKRYDLYRKPNLGLWNLMKEDLKERFGLSKLKISRKSFYCGDAAGRTAPGAFKKRIYPSSKGDFSDADRKFALNIGISFCTPEEFFMGEPSPVPYEIKGFDPKKFMEDLEGAEYKFEPRKKELVVLVGPPGSGKTEFANKYIVPHGYVHISQDVCKTKQKCLELAEKALAKKKSVVVDNINPDVLSRMAYTSLAKKHGYKHIRCIILNTDIEMARHLNNVRHVYSGGSVHKITDTVYNIFKKNYVRPSKIENFDRIETVDFYFDRDKLKDPRWKKIFMMWSE